MKVEFNEVFDAFKNLSETEKKNAIIDFIKKDIKALQQMNNDNVNIENSLDAIYELLHIMTEQMEMFSEKISQDFFEVENQNE